MKLSSDIPSHDDSKTILIENRKALTAFLDSLSIHKISGSPIEAKVVLKLAGFDFEPGVENLIPPQYATMYHTVPLMKFDGGIVVAVADCADQYECVKNIEFLTGGHVEAIAVDRAEIDFALERMYSVEELIGLSDTIDISEVVPQEQVADIESSIDEKPLVELVKRIIFEAIKKNASDIHIRPSEDHIDYLLRIDGNMVLASKFDKRYLQSLISRFKIIGRMNIAEHRLPQDGGAKISINNRIVEIRISVMPTIHGESLVVRLLQTDNMLFEMDQLDFDPHEYDLLLKAVHQSNGLILACGPTGSGKSTTLYALLKTVKKNPSLNIMTVEDPVEFHIEDIEQIQVNRKSGYTFPIALRNILRHDPDVIMIGEIRDEETMKTAIECSLTGHLVLSTLHSIDAISTVTRLLEMGVKPYLLKSTLSTIIAQRLAKINCPHCLEKDDGEIAHSLSSEERFAHIVWQKGAGCKECHNTGLKGRRGIFEVLKVDRALSQVIREGVSEEELEQACSEQDVVWLADKAIKMAEKGEISAEEFIRLRIE